MLQRHQHHAGRFFAEAFQIRFGDDLQDSSVGICHSSGAAGKFFDHAHLTEELVRLQRRKKLLVIGLIIRIDPDRTGSDIIHAVSLIPLTEQESAFAAVDLPQSVGIRLIFIRKHCILALRHPAAHTGDQVSCLQELLDPGQKTAAPQDLAAGLLHLPDGSAHFKIIIRQFSEPAAQICHDIADLGRILPEKFTDFRGGDLHQGSIVLAGNDRRGSRIRFQDRHLSENASFVQRGEMPLILCPVSEKHIRTSGDDHVHAVSQISLPDDDLPPGKSFFNHSFHLPYMIRAAANGSLSSPATAAPVSGSARSRYATFR